MKTIPFLTCLGYYGISTGAADSIEGIYSFDSGNSQLVFNQLYPTGQHYVNGIIYNGVSPLVSLNAAPTRNHFRTLHSYRVGYEHTGNFGLVLDIEYSGCQQSSNNLNVLVSTARNYAALDSGFMVGITPSHRLFFKTSGLTYHVPKELTTRDLVYVSLSERQYVDFGVYNVAEQTYYGQSINVGSGRLNTRDLYIGGMLNHVAAGSSYTYTGYSGLVNSAVLFRNPITNNDIDICADCNFVTGFSIVQNNQTILSEYITGSYWSGSYETLVTGYQNVSGTVLTSAGTTIDILYPSGQIFSVITGEAIIPLTQTGNYIVNRSGYQFFTDVQAINSITKFNLEFDIPFLSGDYIEIYTHGNYNPNIQKNLVNGFFDAETGFPQLIGNGLYENSGIDYNTVHNVISGFDVDDILRYDVLNSGTVITAYSGYWANSKIALDGGGYFPPTSQYFESGNVVYVSNINNVTNNSSGFGYDVYLNGQKLISGIQYDVRAGELVASGDYLLDASGNFILDYLGQPILGGDGIVYSYVGSGFTVMLSGNLPSFTATSLYSGVVVTGVTDVSNSELMFVPQYRGFNRYLISPVDNQVNISNITGFSEQIWVNGVRQTNIIDYIKHKPCELTSGIYDVPVVDFNVFDETFAIVNIEIPPVPLQYDPVQDGPGATCSAYYDGYFEYECPSTSYQGGAIEFWGRINNSPFTLLGSGTVGLYDYFWWQCATQTEDSLEVKMRYRNGNIVGPFSQGKTLNVAV